MRYYGAFLSLADVDPHNSYGWMLHLKKDSFPSFLISIFGAPHLGARIRHRILTKILNGKNDHRSVFDVGCGFGLEALYLSAKGYRVFGIDKSEAKIAIAQKLAKEVGDEGVKFQIADIFKLPQTKEKFDLALLFEVLEHVKTPREMLLKISDFVKADGQLIVSCPAKHWLNAMAKNYLGHQVIGYTPTEVKKLVENDGLEIEKFYSFGNSILAKFFFYIDFILLKFVPLVSAIFFFLSYPIAVFDQENFTGKNPLGYILILRKVK